MAYSRYRPEEMILRDHLARDRTALANERTLLSYARTAIALFAAGGTLLKLFPETPPLEILGGGLLILGTLLTGIGVRRFMIVARHMREISMPSTEEENQA